MSNGEFPGIVIVIGFRSTKRIIEGMKSTIMYRVAVSEKNRFWDTQSLVAYKPDTGLKVNDIRLVRL